MALAISFLINILLGTAAFVTTNIWGLQIMKTALVGILSGYLIPLSFFGPTLRAAAAWLPFPSMLYAPLTLFLGKYHGWAEAGAILGLQAFWVLALALACAALWRKLAARLEILGG
jgi:ABC-2 type transport system permease protein